MHIELSSFAAHLRDSIAGGFRAETFDSLALELFSLQFKSNSAYRKICSARGLSPQTVEHWTQIPTVPTAAFKELGLTSISPVERTTVFHSSGTSEQKLGRHFHSAESLAVYETSLAGWFDLHFSLADELLFLTPSQAQAPHSSLIHMFETLRQKRHLPQTVFLGNRATDGSWALNFNSIIKKLQSAFDLATPLTLLGTAFSFVHLLDYLAENKLKFQLSAGSRVMETGGYKNRSRAMPKSELHALITERLGIACQNIICEYGMSELSSQAYDLAIHPPSSILQSRAFHFPPWSRLQIISPETGRRVSEGETGLIRIFDLANVFSVAAIQTDDLGIRREDGFELIGRAKTAEARGCSLMTA